MERRIYVLIPVPPDYLVMQAFFMDPESGPAAWWPGSLGCPDEPISRGMETMAWREWIPVAYYVSSLPYTMDTTAI